MPLKHVYWEAQFSSKILHLSAQCASFLSIFSNHIFAGKEDATTAVGRFFRANFYLLFSFRFLLVCFFLPSCVCLFNHIFWLSLSITHPRTSTFSLMFLNNRKNFNTYKLEQIFFLFIYLRNIKFNIMYL